MAPTGRDGRHRLRGQLGGVSGCPPFPRGKHPALCLRGPCPPRSHGHWRPSAHSHRPRLTTPQGRPAAAGVVCCFFIRRARMARRACVTNQLSPASRILAKISLFNERTPPPSWARPDARVARDVPRLARGPATWVSRSAGKFVVPASVRWCGSDHTNHARIRPARRLML